MTGKHNKTQEQIIHELRTRVKLEEHNPENVKNFFILIIFIKNQLTCFYLKRFIVLIFQALTKIMTMFGILINSKKLVKMYL